MMSSGSKCKISSKLERLDDDILNSIPLRLDPNIEFSDDDEEDDVRVKSLSKENLSDVDTASIDSGYSIQNLANKQIPAFSLEKWDSSQDFHSSKNNQSSNVRKLYPSEYNCQEEDGRDILSRCANNEPLYSKLSCDSKTTKSASFTPTLSFVNPGSNISETPQVVNLNKDKMCMDKENRSLNSGSFQILESNSCSVPLKIKSISKSKNFCSNRLATPNQKDRLTIDSNSYNPQIVNNNEIKTIQSISKAQNYLSSHLPSYSVQANVVKDRFFSCDSERSHRTGSHVHSTMKTSSIRYQHIPNDISVEFKNTFNSGNSKIEPSNVSLEKPFNMTSNTNEQAHNVSNKVLHTASNILEAGGKENFMNSFHSIMGVNRVTEDNSNSASLKITTNNEKICNNPQVNIWEENMDQFSGSQTLLRSLHNRHLKKDFGHGKSNSNVKSKDYMLSNEMKSSLHISHGRTNYPVIKSTSFSDTGDNSQLQGSRRITEPSKNVNLYKSTSAKTAENSSQVIQKESVEVVKELPHQQCENQKSKEKERLHVSKYAIITDSQLPSNKGPSNYVQVNGKSYAILSMLGKGGSSKVYAVYDPETKVILAVKRVDLTNTESSIREGYKNEVALLKKLQENSRVIKMYDFEYHDDELLLVLEKGDTDLANFIRNKKSIEPLTIKFYWSQMLEAVAEIHRLGVIHSDLKPANFLLVAGQLKLIDFGIASSVQTDMTSIIKDSQVGTLNFMSPEAITDSDPSYTKGSRQHPIIKISVKSDVWSLGCILYNLVYGHTPFHDKPMIKKIKAITDPDFIISFPPLDDTALLDVMKCCLKRDPKERASVEELLKHPYLTAETQNNISQKNLKDVVAQMQFLTPRRIGVVAQLVKNLHSSDQAKRDYLF